jgi:hypothetical protein
LQLPQTAAAASQTPVLFSLSNGTCYADVFPWWPKRSAPVLVAADLNHFLQNWLGMSLVITAIVLVVIASLVSSALIIYHLRANSHNFSPQTYRLHVQLIQLVILQVRIYFYTI